MEFNILTQPIGLSEIIYEGLADQTVDADISLPDYCPDIQRVLKCIVMPRITGVQSSGDRITADGSSVVRVVYVGDDEKISCYEQSYPFSKFIELKEAEENACVFVRPATAYANCRAVSQRRIDVRAMINLNFKVMKKKEEQVLCSAEGAGVQLKREMINAASLVGSIERSFPIVEVAELASEKPAIAQIINTCANAMISDIKTISNKLLIKGELALTTLYCSEDGTVEETECALPISQIIEFEGITEECKNETVLNVTSLEVIPKADGAGEQKMLDISARVSAEITACCETEIPVVSDAYSVSHEIELEKKTFDFLSLAENFEDTYMHKASIDLSGVGAEKILACWCPETQAKAAISNGYLVVSGSLPVELLFRDKDGKGGYAGRTTDFEYKRGLPQPIERLKCNPNVKAVASSCSIGADGKADLKVELIISASVFSNESKRFVSAIEPDESKEKQGKRPAITIYFTDAGEQVWNIARKYNTTVEAIMNENSLSGEAVEEKRMILIPGV